MSASPLTPEMIRDAVVERFLATGQGSTVKDLAGYLLRSESTVRKVITANYGAVDGTLYDEVSRESHSRNYPGQSVGAHKVSVYIPDPQHLRAMLLAARETIAEMTNTINDYARCMGTEPQAQQAPSLQPSRLETARAAYRARFASLAEAGDFEQRVLSAGDEFLPPVARHVRRGGRPSAAYYDWLAAQHASTE